MQYNFVGSRFVLQYKLYCEPGWTCVTIQHRLGSWARRAHRAHRRALVSVGRAGVGRAGGARGAGGWARAGSGTAWAGGCAGGRVAGARARGASAAGARQQARGARPGRWARGLCVRAGPVGCSCTLLGFRPGFSTRYFS